MDKFDATAVEQRKIYEINYSILVKVGAKYQLIQYKQTSPRAIRKFKKYKNPS